MGSSNSNNKIPVIVTGDFNQQRRRDYYPSEWNRIAESASRRRVPTDDGVSSTLDDNNFRCVLDAVKGSSTSTDEEVQCNWDKASPPPSTHWSGTTIDYTYYCSGEEGNKAYSNTASTET